jgi:hypothetical protein
LYLLEHPVLLSSAALGLIQQAKPKEAITNAALASLDNARVHWWQHPDDYPLGHGPLERTVAALRSGEIDYDDAIQRARDLECSGQLSHTYLRAVMLSWVDELQNDLTFTLQAAEIAIEATWAMPLPSLVLDARRAAAEGFIRLVHGGLMRRPDGRLYARAIEIGEWAWHDAEKRGKLPLKGEYLHELGTLALDAFAANFGPSVNYPAEVDAWLARAIDPMPKPADGLQQARAYLSDAADLREPGSNRGRTLKALLEAIVYEAYARGEKLNDAEVQALAGRALADLAPYKDEDAIKRVLALVSLLN